jgi:hypothetical protein
MVVVKRIVSGPVVVSVVGIPVRTVVETEARVPVWTTPLLVRVKVVMGNNSVLDMVVNDIAAKAFCIWSTL